MIIYISGKITGDPCYRYKFSEAEKRLREMGHIVINPAAIFCGKSYKDFIDVDLTLLSKCDAIYMLEGWEDSKGAQLEKHYAEVVGLKVISLKYKAGD